MSKLNLTDESEDKSGDEGRVVLHQTKTKTESQEQIEMQKTVSVCTEGEIKQLAGSKL